MPCEEGPLALSARLQPATAPDFSFAGLRLLYMALYAAFFSLKFPLASFSAVVRPFLIQAASMHVENTRARSLAHIVPRMYTKEGL